VFRPHNVYGPDMGWEHVLPQFALRVRTLAAEHPDGPLPFPIQGDGSETRAFCYIDDLVNGLMHMASSGEHRGIYHIGTQEEVAIRDIAVHVGACFDCELSIEPGPLLKGSTLRRCPDISKLASLGYQPKISLRDGIARLCAWYDQNAEMAPKSKDAK
jgi:nucleoside-diphosphate-sugar epimerase